MLGWGGARTHSATTENQFTACWNCQRQADLPIVAE